MEPSTVGGNGLLYIECLHELSEGALQWVAEAIRLIAKRSGFGRETSPSAEADLKGFFISIYIVVWNPIWTQNCRTYWQHIKGRIKERGRNKKTEE